MVIELPNNFPFDGSQELKEYIFDKIEEIYFRGLDLPDELMYNFKKSLDDARAASGLTRKYTEEL